MSHPPERVAEPRFLDALRDVFGGSPWRFFGAVFGVVALLVVIGWIAHDPIERFATALIARFGSWGVFAATWFGEIVPPLGFQPALFLGYSGGMGPAWLFLVVEAGSLAGSISCWAMGAALRLSPRAVAWLDQRRSARLFRRYGTATVGIAALAPVPYGPITVLGAALGLPFWPALRGMSLRALKIAASLALLVLGWDRG